MDIYLVGWILGYYTLALTFLLRYRTKLFAIISSVFLGLMAIFRGEVGTDTHTYEQIAIGPIWQGMEPGFSVILHFFRQISDSGILAVRFIAVIFLALVLVFLARADRDELFLFLAFVIPCFFYSYSMNVLRIGLASMILLLAVQYERRGRTKKASMLALSSLLFHYSSAVSLFYLWILAVDLKNRRYLANIVLLSLLFGIILLLNSNYFLAKAAIYESSEPLGFLSGLSKLLVIGLILVALPFSELPISEKLKLAFWTMLLCSGFWMIAMFSYAGLRLLDLLSFALPLALFRAYYKYGLKLDLPMKSAIFVAGIVGAIATYRNILDGGSQFFPYEILFSNW